VSGVCRPGHSTAGATCSQRVRRGRGPRAPDGAGGPGGRRAPLCAALRVVPRAARHG
jgi:hypothetical protein